MPLEILNPHLQLRFALKEAGYPPATFRFALLDTATPLIVEAYIDEAKTKRTGSRCIIELDSDSGGAVFDCAPTELYYDGVKLLDFEVFSRYVDFNRKLAVGASVTAIAGNSLVLRMTDFETFISSLWFSNSLNTPVWLLSDNILTGRADGLEFSLDGINFSGRLNDPLSSEVYVRPKLRRDIFDTVCNITDEVLSVVYIDSSEAEDMSFDINNEGSLTVNIAGHDEELCGVEFFDPSGNTVEWFGHAGVIGGLNPARTNTLKAFTELNEVKQYIGTIYIIKQLEIPVAIKIGYQDSAYNNALCQMVSIIPGTNPVMQA